ncbi:MAG: F0F1 ATP synthase subunit B [Candidatus Eisenbacteria bacterium]|nr:F0F1 ATP synthase subunit B [Candidatus Eisenbacteria bacterium]
MNLIWSQVVTQIVGFLIALLILKKYAWGPVLALLEERRQKIQAEFDKIESTRQEVASLKGEVETQLRNMEAQARTRIQEAVQEGQRVAAEITEKARSESRELVERAKDEIARDRDKARVELRNEMVQMVVIATERVVSERMDEAKHKERIASFIDSLTSVNAGASGDARGKGAR